MCYFTIIQLSFFLDGAPPDAQQVERDVAIESANEPFEEALNGRQIEHDAAIEPANEPFEEASDGHQVKREAVIGIAEQL